MQTKDVDYGYGNLMVLHKAKLYNKLYHYLNCPWECGKRLFSYDPLKVSFSVLPLSHTHIHSPTHTNIYFRSVSNSNSIIQSNTFIKRICITFTKEKKCSFSMKVKL